eukprot:PLAT5851.1.p1 GENE.PLAT5851.1~~PLAT5851.1.p1  ORF type:complete len:367 (+),score=131.89 PLAT5851.1:89-1189(+)
MSMSSIAAPAALTPAEKMAARIRAAREEAKSLKAEIAALRSSKVDGSFSDAWKDSADAEAKPMLTSLRHTRTLSGHFDKVYALAWGAAEDLLVTVAADGKLLVWNALSGLKRMVVPLAMRWNMTVDVRRSDDGAVASGGLDNVVSIYSIRGGEPSTRPRASLAAHDGYISCARFYGDDQMLSASGDSTIMLWDVERELPLTVFDTHAADVSWVEASDVQSSLIVSASCDATARVWDVRSGKQTHSFDGHESHVNCARWLPGSLSFATASDDSDVRLFDLRSYSQLQCYSHDSFLCGVTSLDFSSSGRLIFASYEDYHAYAWDTLGDGDRWHHQLPRHDNVVSSIAVNSSGSAVATGSWDTYARVFA